ncbi:WecB/TagA/CpsF family glycosyltransferase [Candidatus Falkowbacteria bacterium]|nr:WecB/TagA/CpsF family glycosyltransferase [Candidatus Falkowbacteria bacterium]
MNEKFILGCKVQDISMNDALMQVEQFLRGNKCHYGVTPNAEICLKGYHDSKLRDITKLADLALPDSFGLKLGAKIQGQELVNRVQGVDFTHELLKLAAKKRAKVVLIGGRGKTGIAAIENCKALYPGLSIDYIHGGEFSAQGVSEYPDFITRLLQAQPDIILVNLGAPKQEYFIDRYRHELSCKFIIGVGGTVDFLSGSIPRAPLWMRKYGLEWLFRLIQEPKRIKRIINAVIIFPLTCVLWRIRNFALYRRGVVAIIMNKDKKILICKRIPRVGDKSRYEHWQFPQGGMDKGETAQETVLREVKEETGITSITIIDRSPRYYTFNWSRNARLFYPFKGQKQDVFLVRFDGEESEIQLDNHEFSAYKWVDPLHLIDSVHDHRKNLARIILQSFEKYLD